MSNDTSFKSAYLALADLHDALRSAYKAANDIDNKDTIFSVMEVVNDEMHEILRNKLDENNDKYAVQTAAFKKVNKRLGVLKDKIDEMIKYVDVASKVVSAIAKVLGILALL